MSVLSYNGLTFPLNQTAEFTCSVEYDPIGKTDPYITVYKIEGICLLNRNLLDIVTAGLSGPDLALVQSARNAPDLIRRMRDIFSKPRKRLSYIVDGVEQIPRFDSIEGTIDSANGPMPLHFKETFITGETILLSIGIVARYWENLVAVGSLTENRNTSPVLYNRWTEVNAIDYRNLVTRTRSGEFRIRSDNSQKMTADKLRVAFAQLSIPRNFLRKQRQYTISPDGLTLHYEIKDEEQIQLPPTVKGAQAAFHADIQYEETTGKQHATRFGRISVTLDGGPAIGAANLYLTAIGIAVNKLNIVTGGLEDKKGKARFIPLASRSHYDTQQNKASFVLQVMYQKTKKRAGGIWGLASAITGNPVRFTGQPSYPAHGNAGLLMEAASYYDPNFLDNGLEKGSFNPTTVDLNAGGYRMNRGKIPGTSGDDT